MSACPPVAAQKQTSWEVREVPIVLQKSPSGLCEIEICNYRIGAPVLLNRCCAFQPDLESIFLAEMLKILLQHNLPLADACSPCSRNEIYGISTADRPHSALMLRARMTLPHFSVSSAMSLPKSAGEPASTVPPRSAS